MICHDQDYPHLCIKVGLNCESCTEATARELARACPGLRGGAVGQLFVQIHTHAACAHMHAHFARAYADASLVPVRKPVGMVRRMAAVA
jgi:hypothetical protein